MISCDAFRTRFEADPHAAIDTATVLEHLRAMDPQWPAADYDVETEKARLSAT